MNIESLLNYSFIFLSKIKTLLIIKCTQVKIIWRTGSGRTRSQERPVKKLSFLLKVMVRAPKRTAV